MDVFYLTDKVSLKDDKLFYKEKEIKKLEHSWEFKFEKKLLKYYDFIVEKASIAIDGISLTIANVDKNSFVISIIPHTFNNTNLQFSKEGELVNVEFDYLARFILNKND